MKNTIIDTVAIRDFYIKGEDGKKEIAFFDYKFKRKNGKITFYIKLQGKGFTEYPMHYRFRQAALSLIDEGWTTTEEAFAMFGVK